MEAATYHPAWNALGTFLWIVVVLAVVFVFRSDLRELLRILVTRLKIGASFKVAGIEIGAAYVEPGSSVIRAGAVSAVREDKNGR